MNIMIMHYLKRTVSVGKGFPPEQLLSTVGVSAGEELGISRLWFCRVRITHLPGARGLRMNAWE